jgi:hypothetical protein
MRSGTAGATGARLCCTGGKLGQASALVLTACRRGAGGYGAAIRAASTPAVSAVLTISDHLLQIEHFPAQTKVQTQTQARHRRWLCSGTKLVRVEMVDPALYSLMHRTVGYSRPHLAGLHRGEDAPGELYPSLGAGVIRQLSLDHVVAQSLLSDVVGRWHKRIVQEGPHRRPHLQRVRADVVPCACIAPAHSPVLAEPVYAVSTVHAKAVFKVHPITSCGGPNPNVLHRSDKHNMSAASRAFGT